MEIYHHSVVMLITQAVFLFLAWIFVLIRLYIRKSMVRDGISVDDYCLVVTVCLYSVFAAMNDVLASVFVFQNPSTLAEIEVVINQIGQGLHYFFLAEIFYTLTAACVRVTVGLLLLRICQDRAQRITVYATMVMMVLVSFTFLFLVVFQCTPVDLFWNFNPGAKGTCHIEHEVLPNAAYVYAGISFLSDWILGLMPIWLLWSVNISRNKKVGIGLMLGLGLLCGIAAILRVIYIERLEDPNRFAANWVGIGICSAIECGLGIIAASIASFRPVFATKWFEAFSARLSFILDKLLPEKSLAEKSKHSWLRSKQSTQKTDFTGTTAEEHPTDVTGSRDGTIDEEQGIRASHSLNRKESVQYQGD